MICTYLGLGFHSAPRKIAVNLFGGFLAVGHSADDQPWTEGNIARGKDSRAPWSSKFRIDFDCALAGRFDSVAGLDKGEVRSLADCEDHGVARND